VGRGRNGNVGLWDGQCFLVIAEKFDDYVVKHESYFTEDWGCFQPFAMVDEGAMAEPFGKVGWDKHYGRRREVVRQASGTVQAGLADSELVGTWMATAYRSDGSRVDYLLALNADRSFHRRLCDHRNGQVLERVDHGQWEHDRNNSMVQFAFGNADAE